MQSFSGRCRHEEDKENNKDPRQLKNLIRERSGEVLQCCTLVLIAMMLLPLLLLLARRKDGRSFSIALANCKLHDMDM
jgi:hypothetical protein